MLPDPVGGDDNPPIKIRIPVACRDRARRADYLRSSMIAEAVRSGSANDQTRVDDLGRVSSS
jgi:hypothetical protein